VFPEKDHAIDCTQASARFRIGEIRVLNSTGNVERTIAFNEADRKLRRALVNLYFRSLAEIVGLAERSEERRRT
jgi:hypothetical protein